MKVTKEMIGAAHDICLKKGDFVLSADLLERIYLAMDALANHSETSGSLKEQLAAVKAENEKLREDAERNKLDQLGEECLRIGRQIQRAAGELPDGFILRVEVEKGAGWVEVYDDEFDLIPTESAGNGLSIDISAAIDAAMKGEK